MQEIIIDKEFESILPALDNDTFTSLEESLLEHGCRDALTLWDGILVDGHNRYSICIKHDIPFKTVNKEFASREDAVIFIIKNQISRRNLNPNHLSYFRGLHYRADKMIVKNAGGKNQFSEVRGQNDPKPKSQSTATRLAGQYRVSPKTIRRDAKVSEAIDAIGEVSPDVKRDILSGKTSISRIQLQELSAGTEKDIEDTVAKLENGTHEKRRPASTRANPNDNHDSDAKRPLEASIRRMTDDFYSEIGNLTDENGVDFQRVLRTYIDNLEAFYSETYSTTVNTTTRVA